MSARRWHGGIAWVTGLVALAWAATGFLHPVMSWTAPRAAVQAPPPHGAPAEGVIAPGPALAAQGAGDVTFVRFLPTASGPAWFAERADGSRIAIDARTGAAAPDAERQRAETLARHYAGSPYAAVSEAAPITAFSDVYPSVNRILPVWQVTLADGLTVFVDPKADRLVTVSNGLRRTLLAVFQNVHTLKFIRIEPLRVAAVLLLVGSVLVTTFFGMMLLLRGRGRGARAWHRAVAWVAAPLVLAFTGSGLFHLVVTSDLTAPPIPEPGAFAAAELVALPRIAGAESLDLVATRGADGRGLWRVATEEGSALYFDGSGQLLPMDDAARAREITGEAGPVRLVTRFDASYGFINKRLPVIGVGEGADAVYADLREGLVAGRASPGIAGVEGWTFDVLHKWEPLAEIIGRRNRDYLTMAAVLIIALTALLGLLVKARRAQ